MENIESLCRVCLNQGNINIFSEIRCDDSISCRLIACAPIEVRVNDGFPSKICSECLIELDNAYRFRKKCELSERIILNQKILPIHKEESNESCSENESIEIEDKLGDSFLEIEEKCDTDVKQDIHFNKESIKVFENINIENSTSNLHIKKFNHKKKNKIKQKHEEKNNTQNMLQPKERDKTRKHMCTTCGKRFLFHGNLLDHERVHSGEKPYICTVCDRRFAQSGHLMVHLRTHTGSKPYQCEICPRAFTVSHALKKHLRIHSGERPYTCTMCDKTFVTSYHLSNHFKRHTGHRDFRCDWPGCQLGFVNSSEMKRHRMRHEKSKTSRALTTYMPILNCD